MDTSPQGRKPFVRNHYLPKWLHRTCNALLPSLVALWLALYLVPLWCAIVGGVTLFFVLLIVDPSRLSFVEGVAGADGYADLDDEQ